MTISWIYTLLLEGNNYYVGFTENLSQRMEQHFTGIGAKWTQLHKPIRIIDVVPETNDWQEDFTTLCMMRKYGINKVRGGIWCSIYPLAQPPLHYDKIDPLKSLDENLRLLSKDTNKRNEIPKEEDTLKYFKEGKNEFQISHLTGMTIIDVESHIVKLIKNGKLNVIDINLTPFKSLQIDSAIKKLHKDNQSVLSIKNLCDRSVSVSDIRYHIALKH